MRRRFLLCYDISDEVRLRRVAKAGEGFGYRLQYSVFVCDLDEAEVVRLRHVLRDIIRYETDRVCIVDLGSAGPSSEKRFLWVSQPWTTFGDPGEPRIV